MEEKLPFQEVSVEYGLNLWEDMDHGNQKCGMDEIIGYIFSWRQPAGSESNGIGGQVVVNKIVTLKFSPEFCL